MHLTCSPWKCNAAAGGNVNWVRVLGYAVDMIVSYVRMEPYCITHDLCAKSLSGLWARRHGLLDTKLRGCTPSGAPTDAPRL